MRSLAVFLIPIVTAPKDWLQLTVLHKLQVVGSELNVYWLPPSLCASRAENSWLEVPSLIGSCKTEGDFVACRAPLSFWLSNMVLVDIFFFEEARYLVEDQHW